MKFIVAFTALALAAASPHRSSAPIAAEWVKPAEYGVGHRVDDVSLVDIDGKAASISDFSASDALVIALNKVNCPVSRKQAATLNALAAEFSSRKVAFLFVNADSHATTAELQTGIAELQYKARYIPDFDDALKIALGAKTTTEIFVLDKTRTLIFRGPIDDQFGVGFELPAPTRSFAREALDLHLTQKPIPEPAWWSPGCLLSLPGPVDTGAPVTFHNQVSRIFSRNCQRCHRPGEIGPFPLTTYRDAVSNAAMIEFMVGRNFMPPWFANPAHGAFKNDPSLTAEDKRTLLDWIASGTPQGNSTDAPLPMPWTTGWQFGIPDAVLSVDKPIRVPASGVIPYQYVIVKNPYSVDRWVDAIEVRPSARNVVHHVLVFNQNAIGGEDASTYFAAMVPGNGVVQCPRGVGRRLKAGVDLVLQIHYTPNGVATTDEPKIGFRFSKSTPPHEMLVASAYETSFVIPAFAPNHIVTATYEFPKDGVLLSFAPHMHLRGKSFRYELVKPDGSLEVLLDVPRYDFNWQLPYILKTPLEVKKHWVIRATAHFDNSEGNPHNPDPSKDIRWGEQSTDEMMIGYLSWYAH